LTCARNAAGNRQKANVVAIHKYRKNPVLIDCLQQANSNGNNRQKHELAHTRGFGFRAKPVRTPDTPGELLSV
ncbi:MAG TPA: hypothetical protein VGR93_08025, partial [Candidatus Acidoferrales bacterium]|nr:hypothetical protein [Candidatus Acidoferrales bacterium]